MNKKPTYEALEQRVKNLESIFHHAPDAIITLDTSHRVLEWNPGAQMIFGYTSDEARGKNLDDLITRPDVEREAQDNTRMVLSGQLIKPIDSVRYKKDGTAVQVTISGAPIIIDTVITGVVAVYTDISRRKQMEEKRTAEMSAVDEKQPKSEPLPQEGVYSKKGVTYLKDQVASILENTKQTSMRSLELLIKDIGGDQLADETRQTVQYISYLCQKLTLPHPVSTSIIQAASLDKCFKILLGEELLLKSEDLTHKDKVMIEKLPYMQVELADLFDFFKDEKSVLLYNHERYDGKGYPEGLAADEIPLGARILSIANAVVAMTSDRPYRAKLDHETMVSELVKNSGTQFDPLLVKSFLDIVTENQLLEVSKEMIDKAKNKLDLSKSTGGNNEA